MVTFQNFAQFWGFCQNFKFFDKISEFCQNITTFVKISVSRRDFDIFMFMNSLLSSHRMSNNWIKSCFLTELNEFSAFFLDALAVFNFVEISVFRQNFKISQKFQNFAAVTEFSQNFRIWLKFCQNLKILAEYQKFCRNFRI